jgi:hypothetical protein
VSILLSRKASNNATAGSLSQDSTSILLEAIRNFEIASLSTSDGLSLDPRYKSKPKTTTLPVTTSYKYSGRSLDKKILLALSLNVSVFKLSLLISLTTSAPYHSRKLLLLSAKIEVAHVNSLHTMFAGY